MKLKPKTARRLRAAALLLLSFLLLKGAESRQWQTVTLENCGTIKVPKTWSVSVEDGYQVFYDQDGAVTLTPFGYISQIRTKDDNGEFLDDYVYKVHTSVLGQQREGILSVERGRVYSNSAWWGRAQYTCNHITVPISCLEFWGYYDKDNDDCPELRYMVSDQVTEYDLKHIIHSYAHK